MAFAANLKIAKFFLDFLFYRGRNIVVDINLGNVCFNCALNWINIYTKSSQVELKDINYQVVPPKNCEECEGEEKEPTTGGNPNDE